MIGSLSFPFYSRSFLLGLSLALVRKKYQARYPTRIAKNDYILPRPRPIILKSNTLSDLRRFHPRGQFRPMVDDLGRRQRMTALPAVKRHRKLAAIPLGALYVENPARAMICVRRQERKQVLMAHGVGGSRVRPPVRTWRSNILCK